MGTWDNHPNCKEEGRFTRWFMTHGTAENRRTTAAWDERGMAAVAGSRRKNLAPRPGKEMGGGRVTRSSNRPTADERRAEREARAAERNGRANAKTVKKLAEGIAEQRKILEDPNASKSAKRSAAAAIGRGRRTAQRVARKTPDAYLESAGVDESSWKRR